MRGMGKTPFPLLCSEAPQGIPVRTMRLRAIMERRLAHTRPSLPAAPGRGLMSVSQVHRQFQSLSGKDLLQRQERSSQTRNHGTTPPCGRELPPGRTRKGEVDLDSLFRVFRWIPWLISDPSEAAIGCCWTESAVRICADLGCRGNTTPRAGEGLTKRTSC